jgi:hypothetical protein
MVKKKMQDSSIFSSNWILMRSISPENELSRPLWERILRNLRGGCGKRVITVTNPLSALFSLTGSFRISRIEKTDPLYSKTACPKWDCIRLRALSALHRDGIELYSTRKGIYFQRIAG